MKALLPERMEEHVRDGGRRVEDSHQENQGCVTLRWSPFPKISSPGKREAGFSQGQAPSWVLRKEADLPSLLSTLCP